MVHSSTQLLVLINHISSKHSDMRYLPDMLTKHITTSAYHFTVYIFQSAVSDLTATYNKQNQLEFALDLLNPTNTVHV